MPARYGTGEPDPHFLLGQSRADPFRIGVKQNRAVLSGNERIGNDAVRETLPDLLLLVASVPAKSVFRSCGQRQRGTFEGFRREGARNFRVLIGDIDKGGGKECQQQEKTHPERERIFHLLTALGWRRRKVFT